MKKIFYFLISACFTVPVLLTLIYSLYDKTNGFSLKRFENLFFNCFSFYDAFWYSVMYTIIITFFALMIIIPAAFAFTQLKSRLADIFFFLLVILMLMPLQVTLLPNYIGLRDMGLLDTPMSIILPSVFSPLYAVVMIQYLRGIDKSIIDAVRLESNSVIRVIITAVIPQIRPCVFAVAILAAAESWNMYEQPVYFLKNNNYMPLNIFMNKASDWDILYPAAVISIIPMLLLYGYFGSAMKKGIVSGGVHE